MTVQIVEIAGQKMVMLPIADYERLLDLAEDRVDAQAASRAQQRREAGEEYLSAEILDQIMAGENPLYVWRKFRGFTQSELGAKAGISAVQVSHIETGKRDTTRKRWQLLADALSVDVDDIIPLD
ncbi:helix-turn-helix transcriptional regulator [Sphingopyxis panaciterrulae]|uniref:DNA-binding XRE family transcriptional regulator n=1 Tax=Sphingopyxis panaciterrulae TaxID=462372 RepID=A0A7W9B7J7_9SPHN|nr:helix-turn-helix transcriptional regulator [Sphingopyxis panaciterrulae]MBB5707693.1 DNA-binding XRE family transcriptional regulator [Sphingopyxis panaciterrulae]